MKHTLLCVKQITSSSLMYDSGHPKPMLCDHLEGWGVGKVGGGIRMEGTRVCLWPIHVDVWQKSSQIYKIIIL